ncbi:hypothetical protein CMV_017939 [Castanea mollissima]|uniref:Uncharacterized protein n=1 Tax=Castanea mollissima TaxID=60419 RepID=A0A8J4VQ20_9ROSI|nr:hypothetical protein CMV_017939 [Castanea mollissima]
MDIVGPSTLFENDEEDVDDKRNGDDIEDRETIEEERRLNQTWASSISVGTCNFFNKSKPILFVRKHTLLTDSVPRFKLATPTE